MQLTRRHLAAVGALALGASNLIRPALAEATDEKAVGDAVEALRKAQLTQDKAQLEALMSDQLSYGHSSGQVDAKAKLIEGTMTRKAIGKSIVRSDLKIAVVGDN